MRRMALVAILALAPAAAAGQTASGTGTQSDAPAAGGAGEELVCLMEDGEEITLVRNEADGSCAFGGTTGELSDGVCRIDGEDERSLTVDPATGALVYEEGDTTRRGVCGPA
ncbi:hypothetical protein [Acuticoccus sp.]|uniref:hypothetical protein n=1 Tax=Acuticoccus sp. TaxID=1904378 RepID=UPI003B51D725